MAEKGDGWEKGWDLKSRASQPLPSSQCGAGRAPTRWSVSAGQAGNPARRAAFCHLKT